MLNLPWLYSPFSVLYLPFSALYFIIHLLFHVCLRIRFLDVETNACPRRPVSAVCRILCSNVRGLSRNLSDLTVAASQFDILLCSETLDSDMRLVSELLVPGFSRPVVLFECGCCEMLAFRVYVVRHCFYVFSFYRNPDLDDRIFIVY